jgi:hypothetical protein
MERLETVSRLSSEYPAWMLERQGDQRVPAPFEG